MSALLAAGWSRSSRQAVSVVPMIQCSPHGMTNSTLVGVRRISPAGSPAAVSRRRSPSGARPGARPWTRAPAGSARRSPSIAPMSSLHTPVAATTLRARTVNDDPSVRSATRRRRPARRPRRPRRRRPGAARSTRALESTRGAVAGGGADDGQRVPGVVDLGVPVADRAADDVPAQARERRQRRPARTGAGAAAISAPAGRTRRRARRRGRRRRRSRRAARPAEVERQQEGQRRDQVRRDGLHQPGPLRQRLVDQREGELLQVAQAAVDQLAGPAGGAGREVAGLEQRHRQPAAGRVQRGTGAGDPAADDQDVDDLVGSAGRGPPAGAPGTAWCGSCPPCPRLCGPARDRLARRGGALRPRASRRSPRSRRRPDAGGRARGR